MSAERKTVAEPSFFWAGAGAVPKEAAPASLADSKLNLYEHFLGINLVFNNVLMT